MADPGTHLYVLLKKILNNMNLYTSHQQVLNLMMGKGDETTPTEYDTFAENKKKEEDQPYCMWWIFSQGHLPAF